MDRPLLSDPKPWSWEEDWLPLLLVTNPEIWPSKTSPKAPEPRKKDLKVKIW